LPLGRVIAHADTMLLNPSTGHLCNQIILSVGLPRCTLDSLNFTATDPSEAMKLFPHRMGFKRSQGFSPIAPLAPVEYPST